MIELRDYQLDAKARTYNALQEGHRPIVCAATGAGKTVIAADLAKDAMEEGKPVLFTSGRREILRQAYDTFVEVCGRDNVGFLMAGEKPWWFYPKVTVASWDTLKSRWNRADTWKIPAEVVLIDECHLALTEKMGSTILPYYEDKTVIGLSATPARRSGRGLGSYFTRIVQVRSVQQLIDDGHLAACEYWAGKHADVSKVKTVKGDFDEKGLSEVSNTNVLVGDVIDNWLRIAKDRHTLVFGVDIAHAQALTERFQSVGVDAAVVHWKMTTKTREQVIQQFRDREIQVLVNVQVASYGFDVPSINCVVLARPTKSVVLHLQMIGRGMRPKPDGDFCMVLDHADNVRRLGAAEDRRRWSLDAKKPATINWERDERNPDKRESVETKCGSCGYMFSRSRVCPKCGWEKPAPSRDVEVVQADLVKVRKHQKDANLTKQDKQEWYRMALGYARMYGKKDSAAMYAYKDRFGEKPPYSWLFLGEINPDQRVKNFITSRNIAFAKRKRQEDRAPRTRSML